MTRSVAGAVAAVLFAAPAFAQAPPKAAANPTAQAINDLIAEKWKEAGIKAPAKRAPDLEYLRRAFIDLIGRIPSSEEVRDFEADGGPDKRARLVKRLLYSTEYAPKVNGAPVPLPPGPEGKRRVLTYNYAEEYAEHWANVWTVWLMTRTGHPVYRERMNYWLAKQFEENKSYKDMVVALLTATGKSNDNAATNFIAHHLGEAVPNDKRAELGKHDAVPITSRVTKLFLGLQTQCAQCHDHPFNKEWVQSDYWGVNAYFRQTTRSVTPTPGGNANGQMMANPANVELTDEPNLNGDGVVFYERRDGKLMAAKPNFLKDLTQAEKGETPNKTVAAATAKASQGDKKKTRRQVLAEYVVSHDNFAPAYVNRIWGHLFGRGLNKEATVDDFGSNNEVVHPELLKKLADEFVQYRYDPKQLLEWICASAPYNLSHEAVPEYADPKFDPYFARMPLKAMSPEVLFESVMTAAKAERLPGDDDRKTARERFMTRLVRNFGDDEGNELTFNGTVIQALLLLNGRELNDEVSKKGNNVVEALVRRMPAKNTAIITEIFLMTVGRHPTQAELTALSNFRKGTHKVLVEVPQPEQWNKPGQKPKPGPAPAGSKADAKPDPKPEAKPDPKADPKPKMVKATVQGANPNLNDLVAFYQDIFWALLNTNEFILNH